MALSTYSELQTEIAAWLDRTDLTTDIVDFITMAEDKIRLDLKAKGLEKRVTTGTADEFVDQPTDFVSEINFQINSDPVRVLRYLTPKQLADRYQTESTGTPYHFTIVGDQFQLRPVPDQSYTYELAYQFKLDRLSTSNTTNWLLTNYPSCYMYAALSVGAARVGNEKLTTWKALYDEVMNMLVKEETKSKRSSFMRMATDVQFTVRN